jgi:hypothetical protein
VHFRCYSPSRALVLAVALFILSTAPALSQNADEDFKVYSDGPRLLLGKQRLRLLQREKERQSERWQQFDTLVSGGAALPEPGFALALHYQVSRQAASAKKAIDWALADKSGDLRQLGLVFDWCGPAMSASQASELSAKIQRLLTTPPPDDDARKESARAMAVIAIADQLPDHGEKILKEIVEVWWRANRLKRLASGHPPFQREDAYAMYEMFHAVRDNLKIDLRDGAAEYFERLPIDHIISNYPPPFSAPENEYRVPAFVRSGTPDLAEAALSRAAALAMVAFDNNAQEVQFVQGWAMEDRFTMRGALGSVYEFLWANPYQPGLSYEKLPLVFHDEKTGRLFARTSWDEDATWLGYFDGQLQMFRDGQLQVLKAGSAAKPVRVGDTVLLTAPTALPDGTVRFAAESETVFVLGLASGGHYDIEVDDEELWEGNADVGGTLMLTLPPEIQAGVRIRKRAE